MDTIQLMKAIEEKRKLAQIQAEDIVGILKDKFNDDRVIRINYRIKEKESILEKIKLFKNTTIKGQNMSEEQLLEEILDIIGITIEVKKFEESLEIEREVEEIILNTRGETKGRKIKIYDSDNEDYRDRRFDLRYLPEEGARICRSTTGWEGILMHYGNEKGIGYEIQILDTENIKIREETHEEFKKIKYQEVRNSITNTKENKSDEREI